MSACLRWSTRSSGAIKPVEPEEIAAAVIKILEKPKTHVSVPAPLRFTAQAAQMLGPRGRRWLNKRLGLDTVFLDFDVNAHGTFNMLDAARRFCPDAPFLFASTNKVYGKITGASSELRGNRYAYTNRPDGIPTYATALDGKGTHASPRRSSAGDLVDSPLIVDNRSTLRPPRPASENGGCLA